MAPRKGGIPKAFLTERQKENAKKNANFVPRSKYMIAAEAHRGEVWVRDPTLL